VQEAIAIPLTLSC